MYFCSGHYICDVVEGDGSNWLCFNDSQVSRRSKDEIVQKRASTAYLLFYVERYVTTLHPGYLGEKQKCAFLITRRPSFVHSDAGEGDKGVG